MISAKYNTPPQKKKQKKQTNKQKANKAKQTNKQTKTKLDNSFLTFV